ncbi:hypothetical protein ACO2Q7_00205 [Rathayibacter sp. KR2-224]|uniref:hypothetical protein n=1 Tax=Rathayibacter sp. KR2-224 TaxID=3400913 RepID=UPI003C119635
MSLGRDLRPAAAHRGARLERSILVLDVVCILGIVALGVVVALVSRAVEKL